MTDDSGFTLAVFQQHVNFQQTINIVAKTNINGLNVPVRLQHDVKRIDQDIIFHLMAFALVYPDANRVLLRVHGGVRFHF